MDRQVSAKRRPTSGRQSADGQKTGGPPVASASGPLMWPLAGRYRTAKLLRAGLYINLLTYLLIFIHLYLLTYIYLLRPIFIYLYSFISLILIHSLQLRQHPQQREAICAKLSEERRNNQH